MIKIREYVSVHYDEKNIIYIYRKQIKVSKTEETLKITKKLIEGVELDYLNEQFNKQIVSTICLSLEKSNMLSTYIAEKQNTIEERFLYYLDQYNGSPYKKYEKLNQSLVCIIGVGGVGGNILQILASSGIQKFILIDYDVVEYSNLNRQFMYTINDVGRKKVEVCKEKLLALNPIIDCKIYDIKIESQEVLLDLLNENSEIDVIVSGADSPIGIQKIIQQVALVKKSAFCSGGLGIDYGSYIFNEPCKMKRDYIIPKKEETILNRRAPLGSFGGTNSIISSFMAYDIVNYLIGETTWSNGQNIVFDFFNKKYFISDKK